MEISGAESRAAFPSPNVLTLAICSCSTRPRSCAAIVSEAFKTCSPAQTVFFSLAHWSLCATSLWWSQAGLQWAGLASLIYT